MVNMILKNLVYNLSLLINDVGLLTPLGFSESLEFNLLPWVSPLAIHVKLLWSSGIDI